MWIKSDNRPGKVQSGKKQSLKKVSKSKRFGCVYTRILPSHV